MREQNLSNQSNNIAKTLFTCKKIIKKNKPKHSP